MNHQILAWWTILYILEKLYKVLNWVITFKISLFVFEFSFTSIKPPNGSKKNFDRKQPCLCMTVMYQYKEHWLSFCFPVPQAFLWNHHIWHHITLCTFVVLPFDVGQLYVGAWGSIVLWLDWIFSRQVRNRDCSSNQTSEDQDNWYRLESRESFLKSIFLTFEPWGIHKIWNETRQIVQLKFMLRTRINYSRIA